MNKLKTKMTALLLAILFMAACFVPLYGVVRASAYGGSSTEQTMDVLYIGDNAQHAAYIEGSAPDAEIYCRTSNFEGSFITEYYDGTFDNVSNTYVIFEMQQRLGMINMDTIAEGWFLPDVLNSMFELMKEQNCKIMFIFGSAEERWEGYNEFLDYVDIHINTDTFYIFFTNVFTNMKEASGDWQLPNVAFLFDALLTDHPGAPSVTDSWFFREWFTPYFKTVYSYTGTVSAEEVFANNMILCHEQVNTYYDAVHGTTGTFTAESLAAEVYDYTLCPIGYYSAENDYGWLLEMENLQEALGEYFPIYVYNTGSRVLLWGEAIYTSGQFNNIPDIIEEFINGEDMSDYDNMEGRCDVTHFPMEFSENGWMEMPSGDGPFKDCWKCFLTDEEYKFLTNQEGEGAWTLVW